MKKNSIYVMTSLIIMGMSTMLINPTSTAYANTTCQNNDSINTIKDSTNIIKTNSTNTTKIQNQSTAKVSKKEKKIKNVVKLVNKERAKAGLTPLKLDTAAKKAANVRAKEIVKLFDHKRPNGSGFSTALTENGVKFNGAGENIAWGQKTAKEVVNAWMNSPGHRANIMNPKFTTIGVGFYKSGGTNYWTQLFTY